VDGSGAAAGEGIQPVRGRGAGHNLNVFHTARRLSVRLFLVANKTCLPPGSWCPEPLVDQGFLIMPILSLPPRDPTPSLELRLEQDWLRCQQSQQSGTWFAKE